MHDDMIRRIEPLIPALRRYARALCGDRAQADDQRSILLLVSIEDLSYAETAKVLDIPLGTVMSRLSRGRERLRQILDGDRRNNGDRQSTPNLRRVK